MDECRPEPTVACSTPARNVPVKPMQPGAGVPGAARSSRPPRRFARLIRPRAPRLTWVRSTRTPSTACVGRLTNPPARAVLGTATVFAISQSTSEFDSVAKPRSGDHDRRRSRRPLLPRRVRRACGPSAGYFFGDFLSCFGFLTSFFCFLFPLAMARRPFEDGSVPDRPRSRERRRYRRPW